MHMPITISHTILRTVMLNHLRNTDDVALRNNNLVIESYIWEGDKRRKIYSTEWHM